MYSHLSMINSAVEYYIELILIYTNSGATLKKDYVKNHFELCESLIKKLNNKALSEKFKRRREDFPLKIKTI